MLVKGKGEWVREGDISSLIHGSRPGVDLQQLQLNKATINLIGPKFTSPLGPWVVYQ